jgi:hypothetical protein
LQHPLCPLITAASLVLFDASLPKVFEAAQSKKQNPANANVGQNYNLLLTEKLIATQENCQENCNRDWKNETDKQQD